jgi:hypothetical protein
MVRLIHIETTLWALSALAMVKCGYLAAMLASGG